MVDFEGTLRTVALLTELRIALASRVVREEISLLEVLEDTMDFARLMTDAELDDKAMMVSASQFKEMVYAALLVVRS